MSRTYRRMRDKPHNFSRYSTQFSSYAYESVLVLEGERDGWKHFLFQDVPYEGKELAKKKAWYHSDRHIGLTYRKSWRKTTHVNHRAQFKAQLAKFKKDPDFEVQDIPLDCLIWWW